MSTSSAPASIAASATSSAIDPVASDGDQAARLELPGDRARARELAAGLREDRPHLGGGPVAVVGRGLDEERDAARAVALVDDLLELLRLAAAGRLLDRPLDVVGGHVDRARLLDRQPKPVVRVRVAAALACCDADLAGDLREERAALGVVGALLALDRGPLGMPGHRGPEYSRRTIMARPRPTHPREAAPESPDQAPPSSRQPRNREVRPSMTMKSVDPAHLRSVVLAGHAGGGKTTLAEHLLFQAGAIQRLGKVDDGTAHLDYEPEEQKRQQSLSLAVATFEHDADADHPGRHARLPGLRGGGRRGLRRRGWGAVRHGRVGRRRGRPRERRRPRPIDRPGRLLLHQQVATGRTPNPDGCPRRAPRRVRQQDRAAPSSRSAPASRSRATSTSSTARPGGSMARRRSRSRSRTTWPTRSPAAATSSSRPPPRPTTTS